MSQKIKKKLKSNTFIVYDRNRWKKDPNEAKLIKTLKILNSIEKKIDISLKLLKS